MFEKNYYFTIANLCLLIYNIIKKLQNITNKEENVMIKNISSDKEYTNESAE